MEDTFLEKTRTPAIKSVDVSSMSEQRAYAFDNLKKRDAMQKYPELDGAYHQLHELKEGWPSHFSEEKCRESYLALKKALSDQLHQGHIPQGNVTREESRSVIEHAARGHGLMMRDMDDMRRDYHGQIIAVSSHHALVKVSDKFTICCEKSNFGPDISVGDPVALQQNMAPRILHEQNLASIHEISRGDSHEIAR